MTSRRNSPMTRVDSAVAAPGAGTFDRVVAEVGQAQVAQQQAAVGVRVGAHAALAARRQLRELGQQPALVVEQLLRPVALHPLFEDAHVLGLLVHLAQRHLVRAPVALGASCRRPPSGRSSPWACAARSSASAGASAAACCAFALMLPDLADDRVQGGGHELVHRLRARRPRRNAACSRSRGRAAPAPRG